MDPRDQNQHAMEIGREREEYQTFSNLSMCILYPLTITKFNTSCQYTINQKLADYYYLINEVKLATSTKVVLETAGTPPGEVDECQQ